MPGVRSSAMKLTPRLAAPALLALLALTAACGSSPSSSAQVASLGSSETTADSAAGTTAPANMEDAMLAFAQCMRDHGIDMPDPEFKDDGGGFTVGLPEGKDNQDKTKLDEAQKGCQPILANAQGNVDIDPQKQAEMEQKLLEYAQCMRDHGIDMADP